MLMTIEIENFFRPLKGKPQDEVIETLIEGGRFRLERIVSTGQHTPENEWVDQDQDEWVLLLTGKSRLRFEDPEEECTLCPGDFLLIPAHRRHRVEWTDPGKQTTWLTLHHTR